MGFSKKLRSLAFGHKLLSSSIFLLLILASLGIYQVSSLKTSRQEALDLFYRQQEEKRVNLEKTYEQIHSSLIEEQAREHAKNQKLAEKVVKDFNPSLPNCSKLENRMNIIILDNNCKYKIQALGETNMAVILLFDPKVGYFSSDFKELTDKKGDQKSLFYINTYLKKEALRYGISGVKVSLEFFGPLKFVEKVAKPTMGAHDYLDASEKTSKHHKIPEQNYDLVYYMNLSGGGGWAFPAHHRAFSDVSVAGFIHETLHLFGATDKYWNNDCNTIGRANPFDKTQKPQELFDIMCSLWPLKNAIINTITAREIGWPN